MTSPAEPDQLVVAQQHLRPLVTALTEADCRYETLEVNRDLDLALVKLPEPEQAARNLLLWSRQQGPSTADTTLDRILYGLRTGFAHRYFGWTPQLGKNRYVGRIHGRAGDDVAGAGEVSHGGGGAPVAIAKPAWASDRQTAEPSGVTVGLIDTEMVNHDYLAGGWTGAPPPACDGEPCTAEEGHATFITGLIRRYAPAATVRVYPVLEENGDGNAWNAAKRIVQAGRDGVDELNLSFVCHTDDGDGPLVLAAALSKLGDTVVVAAAGNHGHLPDGREYLPAFPAAFPNVIAVGAQGAPFSAKGPWITVIAPGSDLESTYLTGPVSVWEDPDGPGPHPPVRVVKTFSGYARWSGTSFAAALVSAAIAARTVPGRRTATEAADELLGSALSQGEPARLTLDSRDPVLV
ncbi:S8 family peptidase [Actinoplanes couchii]|uniref:Peptidase S8/S53 domain-containing protein n=1 Tax=Actinoplanes couchii TaxID=403638 RepID=A0ABQ3XF45_9ACTN|nr:S8/S53 family peptidase [Actinoplanes couchii]MDR6319908.1 hypothetical protein [Actinoplanes couchii]GID57045.1 hypothetical protein Aco03nite_054490 [Actinoplanes couchii]